MNLIQLIDCWRADDKFSWSTFYFIVVKEGSLKNLFEYYFLNVVVNVNLFSDLKFEYYCENYPEILPQVSLK